MDSSWIDEDITKLKGVALDEQLKAIFGFTEANQFLNPTIQDKPQNISSRQIKRNEHIGAHDLWHSLRSTSLKKLMHKTRDFKDIELCFPSENNERRLHMIEEYKQRCELMYRVAHLNETKTQQILRHVKLPMITGDIVGVKDLKPHHTDQILNSEKGAHLLPNISEKTVLKQRNTMEVSSNSHSKIDKDISFLSEKDSHCMGQFRDRMKSLGVDSNVGIARPLQGYKAKATGVVISRSHQHNKSVSFQDTSHDLKKQKVHKPMDRSHSWQPLTLNALVEYTKILPAPGEGRFRHGEVQTWKAN